MQWRRFWRRFSSSPRRNRRGGDGLIFSAILGIGLAVFLIWTINRQLMPIVSSMATTKVSNAVTQELEKAVNDYISSQDLSYNDIISLEKDDTGAVTALTSNMVRLNSMRNTILNEVVSSIDKLDSAEISIPIGNITGISFLSGRGMTLPVQVISVGTARAAFDQVFTAVGINQTRHQIMLNVTVSVSILIPGDTITTNVSTQVCAAETVIVGGVPQTYLQVGQ